MADPYTAIASPAASDPYAAFSSPSEPTAEGAHWMTRLKVGTARERDRLATLRQDYPDAKPYGDGNFIFTDEQGQRRLYNPHGPDFGDVVASTGDIAGMVGMAAGGASGMAAAGPPGAVAGMALGNAGAGQIVDIIRKAAGLPSTGTPLQKAADVGGDAATGAASEMGGQALGTGAGQFLARTMTRPDAPAIIDAAQKIGLRPHAGMVGRAPVSSVETMLNKVLPGAATEDVRLANAKQIQNFAEGTIPGPVPTNLQDSKQIAGEAIRSAATRTAEGFKKLRESYDNQFMASMPKGAAFDINGVRAMAANMQAKIAQAPETFGKALAGPLAFVKGVISDADKNGGKLPVDTLRQMRTHLGQAMDDPTAAATIGMDQQSMRQLYGALRGDIRDAAANVSPQAAALLDRHDKLVQAFRGSDAGVETMAGSIDKILKNGVDEKLYSALRAGGADRIAQVMAGANPAERQALGRMALEDISKSPTTNEFDVNRLVREWDKMAPSTRSILFGRVMNTSHMDDLMAVLRPMREADRARNFSNTAYTAAQTAGLAGLAGGVAGMATGGGTSALETIGTQLGGGYALSWTMAQPGVARWMANSMRAGGPRTLPEGLAQQLRAAAIREGVDGQ